MPEIKVKNLFVEDSRWPNEVTWVNFDYTSVDWVIVRNYKDFIAIIQEQDFDIISFDHDLDNSSTFECIRCKTAEQKFDYSRVKEPTGYHCALFLKDYCQKNEKKIPKYLLHSLNEQGRQNIKNVLGEETLIAEMRSDLFIQKADEILDKRIKKNDKRN